MHPSFHLMGREVRDLVSNISGVVDSICFDLYGCIQASVRPKGLDDKGSPFPAHWYDVKRLVVTRNNKNPVMPVPDFSRPEIGSASKAPR